MGWSWLGGGIFKAVRGAVVLEVVQCASYIQTLFKENLGSSFIIQMKQREHLKPLLE